MNRILFTLDIDKDCSNRGRRSLTKMNNLRQCLALNRRVNATALPVFILLLYLYN